MAAPLPGCPNCGATLARRFSVPAVHYQSAGFYSSDVTRLKAQVGPERFAQFEARKDDVERRAKAGRLTGYERSLEVAHA